MRFKTYIIEKRENYKTGTGNTKGKKILREYLVAKFLIFHNKNSKMPTFEEAQDLLNTPPHSLDGELNQHYYDNAYHQASLINKNCKRPLHWALEGDAEADIIESLITLKKIGVNKNNFQPADIWGFTTQGLSNIATFDMKHRNTPKTLMRRLTSAFFNENLLSQDIVGVSLKENPKATLEKFVNNDADRLPPVDGFTLSGPIIFGASPKITGSNNVNKVTAMISLKIKETKYKFFPVINLNGKATSLSIIIKGSGGGSQQQSTATYDILEYLDYINLTKVKLYGNNRGASGVTKVPKPNKKIFDDAVNRLKKSQSMLTTKSSDKMVTLLKHEDFIEDGVMNVGAWGRALVLISWVSMALENWKVFSEAAYVASMKVTDNFAPYWKVS